MTRFARDKYDHFALHSHLKSLGISLRSATEPIDDTSTGKLMEGVLAAFAQFDNDLRSDRTRAGMQEALRRGRWTFLGPLGYLNASRAMRQSLMPDPERAAIVRRLFKHYATGTYTKQQILQAIGMLRNRLYVGILDVPEFGVRDQRGDMVDRLVRFRRSSIEVPLREFTSRPRFQIPLKTNGSLLVGELDDDV